MFHRVSIPNDQEFGGISPKDRLLARAMSQSVPKRTKISQKALEAKRKTNRQSARRCRLRQKILVKELQDKNALLTMKNNNLMLKLELSEAENRKLRLMQNQETKSGTQAEPGTPRTPFQGPTANPRSTSTSSSKHSSSLASASSHDGLGTA